MILSSFLSWSRKHSIVCCMPSGLMRYFQGIYNHRSQCNIKLCTATVSPSFAAQQFNFPLEGMKAGNRSSYCYKKVEVMHCSNPLGRRGKEKAALHVPVDKRMSAKPINHFDKRFSIEGVFKKHSNRCG